MSEDCTCSRIRIGTEVYSGSANLNPNCPVHGEGTHYLEDVIKRHRDKMAKIRKGILS